MNKIITFGCFDIFHKGHKEMLRFAKNLGELYVVVTNDERYFKEKKQTPFYNVDKRIEEIRKWDSEINVIIGPTDNKEKVFDEIKPDAIVIGYDKDLEKVKEKYSEYEIIQFEKIGNFSSSKIKSEEK